MFDIKTELKQTYLNSLQNRNIMVVTCDGSEKLSSDLCFTLPFHKQVIRLARF